MRPHLSVPFYHPRHGNFQHWAIHLHTSAQDLIFEVDGEHPGFRKVTIGEVDVPTIKAAIDAVRVDNKTLEWDCPEYTLEILDGYEKEAVLDEADEEYKEAKEILKRKRGPLTYWGFIYHSISHNKIPVLIYPSPI
ncbi:uncharacterized protein ATNIH1004_002996 [Aspergillus tanneri]|uniref:Uncharacterized protein n=1 Tax=Aspergillus tanneri TaxID=1220188 RepID=A0A5M9MT60_9EURO|nr:uncharacterized protein ATNIH1004_002996 [Aspergillus tanneri]KAA8650312.1 hypothetical protein ATNIH1004_002996 [Aspergillus tanneri]